MDWPCRQTFPLPIRQQSERTDDVRVRGYGEAAFAPLVNVKSKRGALVPRGLDTPATACPANAEWRKRKKRERRRRSGNTCGQQKERQAANGAAELGKCEHRAG